MSLYSPGNNIFFLQQNFPVLTEGDIPLHPAGSGGEPPGRQRYFENLQKISKENCKRMHYFRRYFIKFQDPAYIFSRVWTKNTNGREILGKVLLKIERNEICIIIFLQKFFHSEEEGVPRVPPPLAAPMLPLRV